jgi:carbonic anhydrase/acetyltransferase-like protein (isoleucine patch superfamily)
VIGDVELGDDASVWMSHVSYKETYRAEAEEGR